jgi:hypothetical protein
MLLIKQSLFAHFFLYGERMGHHRKHCSRYRHDGKRFHRKEKNARTGTAWLKARTMLPMMPHALFSAIDTPISIMLKTAANANNNNFKSVTFFCKLKVWR